MLTPTSSLNRRTILGRGGVIAAALGIGGGVRHATVRAQSSEMADHPMVGVWLAITPLGPAPTHILTNGSFISSSAPVSAGPDGSITFASPQTGSWEPDPENDRGIHFTSVQAQHDAEGTYLGTVTIDGYPAASEDGESFYDEATRAKLTIRDAAGTVTMVIEPLPPVYGDRLRPGAPGIPEGTPEAGTPTS